MNFLCLISFFINFLLGSEFEICSSSSSLLTQILAQFLARSPYQPNQTVSGAYVVLVRRMWPHLSYCDRRSWKYSASGSPTLMHFLILFCYFHHRGFKTLILSFVFPSPNLQDQNFTMVLFFPIFSLLM